MRRMALVAGVVSLVAAASCIGGPEDVSSSAVTLAAYQGGPELPFCHWIVSDLRGKEGSVWPVKNFRDLLAIDMDGDIVCVDTTTQALELGLTAIPPVAQPICDICDGTPLPADQFNAAARSHSVDRSEL